MKKLSDFAKIVYLRTYSRKKENGEYENWEETVNRVIEGNIGKYRGTKFIEPDEEKQLRKLMLNMKATPAGRGLWLSGTEIQDKLKASGLTNCYTLAMDNYKNYCIAMDMLMLGGGVGMTVEHKYVSKLPRVKSGVVIENKETKDADFIVPDSREGWVKLLEKVLTSYFTTGESFSYSCVVIREKGEEIKGFGGKASGKEPLILGISKICDILGKKANKRINPIDAGDILCCIAELIVAGNVRRCIPEGALVHTKRGLIPIEEVTDKDQVITTQGYKNVKNTFKQGKQNLIKILTSDGFFECTKNHKMAVMVAPDKYEWKLASDITNQDFLVSGRYEIEGIKTYLPKWEYKKSIHSTTCQDIIIPELDSDMAWLIGLFQADGYTYANRVNNGFNAYISIVVGLDELEILEKAKLQIERFGITNAKLQKRKGENSYQLHVQSKQLAWYFDEHFKKPNTPIEIPTFILQSTKDIRLGYIAGIMDGDGSVKNKPTLVTSTIYDSFAYGIQSVLYSCGIESRVVMGRDCNSRPQHWQKQYKVSLINETARMRFAKVPQLFKKIKPNKTGQYTTGYPEKWFTENRALLHANPKIEMVSVNQYDKVYGENHLLPIKVLGVETTNIEKETYDIEVEDVHEFFCNGYLTHNSALMLQGDPFDKDFLKSKRWDMGVIPSYRAMANYSVNCSDIDDLHPLFWETYLHGEPFGIVNVANANKYGRIGYLKKDKAVVANPCQPAWATVLTPKGISTIGKVNIGDLIWSESGWTTILNKISSGIKPILEYRTSSGCFIGTENHRIVSNGIKVEAKNANSIDVLTGSSIHSLDNDVNAIMDGLVIGDGSTHPSSTYKVYLIIGKNDTDYFNSEISNLIIGKHSVKHNAYKVVSSITEDELSVLPERVIPDRYFYGEPKLVASFLRGLYSANGSIIGNRVALKSTSFSLIQQVQIMLSSLGIQSYYTTNKSKKVKFNNGEYLCKESYDLNIIGDRGIFKDLIGFIQNYKSNKLEESCNKIKNRKKDTYDITKIIPIDNEEVFDITVDNDTHTYWTGGVNVSNCGEQIMESGGACNLVTLYLPNISNLDEFKLAARLMYRYAKRVALEGYHQSLMDKVVKNTMRVGVDINGCLMSSLFTPENLDIVYKVIEDEDKKYSSILGVPESIRLTTNKPNGTLSSIGDTTAGIHPAFSRYYIRRMRISSNNPLVKILEDSNYPIEPSIRLDSSLDLNTLVVSFPMCVSNDVPVADENWDIDKQLDVVKMVSKHWSDSAVSVTVYYEPDNISDIQNWLRENLSTIKSISFLKISAHGFKQAPYEKITEEEYKKMLSNIKPINFDDFHINPQDNEELLDCESGACPIK